MRVKCIDKGRSTILEVGEEYEVFEEIGDKYLVSTKLLGATLYLKKYFELIKEDKMEIKIKNLVEESGVPQGLVADGLVGCFCFSKENEIRIVRNLEELNGLENGMGLRVLACDVSDREEYKNINITVLRENWRIAEILGPIEIKVKTLKAMGFKFEYKPLRTINEVISEMKEVGKVTQCALGDVTWEVYLANSSKEYCTHRSNCPSIGTLWFNKENAQKYADELNEIVGDVK